MSLSLAVIFAELKSQTIRVTKADHFQSVDAATEFLAEATICWSKISHRSD
jgi:hypothetical protein